ncbi:MAG: DegT/DnrJ/EryC1/StrS family aminotransferase [Chitinophagaceae bacterium]|nr:DegT/DnrJ/EryC1/StrS family aminotransferase [Chitinophagaceae bacterium]
MIPFSPPFIDDDVIQEVNDVLTSGWITTGPKVQQLEHDVKEFTGCEEVVCVNSATSGLMLALRCFGIGKDDEVIIPAYTYAATALAVYHIGAKPVMVDIKSDFTIDPEKVREAITGRTKAIIPVDIAGWPADYDALYSLVVEPEVKVKFNPTSDEQKKLGRILILSDGAHSFGATYKGKPSGFIADITIFSFHAVKNVTTAEGGCVCLNLPSPFDNNELFKKLKLMLLNGQTKDAYTKSKAGGWRYDIVLPGYKMNMPDICAAIGLAQLRKYKKYLIKERQRVALTYDNVFKPYEWVELPALQVGNTSTSFHIYPLRIKNITEQQRDRMIDEIINYDVSVNVHFIPLPMFSFFKSTGYKINDFPVSYDCYSREISLPVYPQLTSEQIGIVTNAVIKSYYKVINSD